MSYYSSCIFKNIFKTINQQSIGKRYKEKWSINLNSYVYTLYEKLEMTRKSRKCVVTKAGQALECFHLQIERARREDLKVSYLSAHVPRYLTFDADDIEILQGQMFVKSHLAFSSSSDYPFRTYLMIVTWHVCISNT